jgi:hypothetical protein
MCFPLLFVVHSYLIPFAFLKMQEQNQKVNM